MSDDLRYQTGFGNHLASEAISGALPRRQNFPREAPLGLIAEQINGTGFTLERRANLRTVLYRLRPAVHDRGFTPLADSPRGFETRFEEGVSLPQVQRYRPLEIPADPVDFLDGVQTFAGAGDPAIKRGIAVHLFAASADMERVFCNIDGDLLLAPQEGSLRVQTELGWLQASPGELLILPRGLRFRVLLPEGRVRGFAAELYDGHFQLPERGLIGSNGLADERHFRAPVAAYEDVAEDTEIIVKQGGRFWRTVAPNSPFDVVAWHGTYAPFVYDLDDFMSLGSVSHDHPDPSILTVLTSPMDTRGRNAIDVGVFRGRWDPTEHTFRPPFLHRNTAVEFNFVIKTARTRGPYLPGAFSWTPALSPHGVLPSSYARETARTKKDVPSRTPETELWVQWESCYQLGLMPWMVGHACEERHFGSGFRNYPAGG